MAGYGNYTTLTNQTPTEKISSMATPAVQNLSTQAQSITSGLSNKLVSTGLSIGAIAATVSTGLDNTISSLKGDVTSLTQSVTNRADPNQLISSRVSYKENPETFATSHMPEKKVAAEIESASGPRYLEYPPDLRKYYISFELGKYERPNPYTATSAFSSDTNIVLPMPSNLLDPNGVKLKPTELGGLLGAGVENISAIIQDIQAGGAFKQDTAKEQLKQGKAMINQGVGAGYNALFESASIIPGLDDIAGVAGQLLGAVPNPHVTVFFQGVDLRSHSFTWRFAPKNAKESATIVSIIKEFKASMLPNYRWGAANVLGYPKMVKISLEPQVLTDLYMFKPCMISAVNVNYAPNGIPSFFAGTNQPTAIEFQVSFQELEIFTSQDYGGQNGDAAGYLADLAKAGIKAATPNVEDLGGTPSYGQ